MLKLRIMSYSMAMKIKIFTFNLISGPPSHYRVWRATEMGQDDITMTSGLSDRGNINPVIIMFIMLTSV